MVFPEETALRLILDPRQTGVVLVGNEMAGAEGVTGWALITALADAGDVHPGVVEE